MNNVPFLYKHTTAYLFLLYLPNLTSILIVEVVGGMLVVMSANGSRSSDNSNYSSMLASTGLCPNLRVDTRMIRRKPFDTTVVSEIIFQLIPNEWQSTLIHDDQHSLTLLYMGLKKLQFTWRVIMTPSGKWFYGPLFESNWLVTQKVCKIRPRSGEKQIEMWRGSQKF